MSKSEEGSLTQLKHLVGKKIEIIAFDISYIGILEQIDFEQGILKLIDGDDFVILELERVESFNLIH